MRTGVMVFDEKRHAWRIYIDKDVFETATGMHFELCIRDHFYKVVFEEDYFDWFVTIEDEVDFSLRLVESYKVRIHENEWMP